MSGWPNVSLLSRFRVVRSASTLQILCQRRVQIRSEVCTPTYNSRRHSGQPADGLSTWTTVPTSSWSWSRSTTSATTRPPLNAGTRARSKTEWRRAARFRELPIRPAKWVRVPANRYDLHLSITYVRLTHARQSLRCFASNTRLISLGRTASKLFR